MRGGLAAWRIMRVEMVQDRAASDILRVEVISQEVMLQELQEMLRSIPQSLYEAQLPTARPQEIEAVRSACVVAIEGHESQDCPICLMGLGSHRNGVKTHCCGKLFHPDCLFRWLGEESRRCPMCRAELVGVSEERADENNAG